MDRFERRIQIDSPSGASRVTFELRYEPGRSDVELYYAFDQVDPRGSRRAVALPSRLGLQVGERNALTGVAFAPAATRTVRESWRPIYGERAEVLDHYVHATLRLQTADGGLCPVAVECRVYDGALAFRYVVKDALSDLSVHAAFVDATGDRPDDFPGVVPGVAPGVASGVVPGVAPGVASAATSDPEPGDATPVVDRELTEFRFPDGCRGYEEHGSESEHVLTPIAQIRAGCEWPLTIAYPDGTCAFITEAAVVDTAPMQFAPTPGGGLSARLREPVPLHQGRVWPWRLIATAESPGGLLSHSDLVLNLNPPCAVTDTAWIKPGKAIRDVTLSTRGAMACIDFARKNGLQYVLFDAGWYGPENDPASDARRVQVDLKKAGPDHSGLDLERVIDYGNEHGVGILLYVNRRALERQLDELLPLYAAWGVKGLKFGFVEIGSGRAIQFLYDAVRKAAEHRLMVDIHDAYRPTGWSRTFPNLLTQEGVRGNEHMPTAAHNATLPFTRFTIGAADCTICWLDRRLVNTPGHQAALGVIVYSPLQLVYWYDRPEEIDDAAALEWFGRLPTVWHECVVLHDRIGEHATIARRSGDEWFLGSVTNDEARSIEMPLDFLTPGQTYVATIYGDEGEDEGQDQDQGRDQGRGQDQGRGRRLVRSTRTLTAGARLSVQLKPCGGIAIRISPA